VIFFNFHFAGTAFFVHSVKIDVLISPRPTPPKKNKKNKNPVQSLSRNTPHGIHRNRRVQRGRTVDSRVIALQPVVYHRTALQLLIVIIHKFWHRNPPHVLPQKLHPVHIFQLPVQPAVCTIRALKDAREIFFNSIRRSKQEKILPSTENQTSKGGEEESGL
jgi:hypothetical protein